MSHWKNIRKADNMVWFELSHFVLSVERTVDWTRSKKLSGLLFEKINWKKNITSNKCLEFAVPSKNACSSIFIDGVLSERLYKKNLSW